MAPAIQFEGASYITTELVRIDGPVVYVETHEAAAQLNAIKDLGHTPIAVEPFEGEEVGDNGTSTRGTVTLSPETTFIY